MNTPRALDFENLFISLPSMCIVFDVDDPKFTITAQNDAHARHSMVASKDVVGRPVLEAYPDTSDKYQKTGVSDLVESIRKVIRTKKPDTMPLLRYDLKDPSGKYVKRYWRVIHYPAFDKTNQNVVAVIQVTTDITNEVTSEKELERTTMQLERALSMANIGGWQWHIPTNRVTGTENLARMFGIPEKVAANGMPIETFTNAIYDEDRAAVLKAIETALAHKGAFRQEYRTVNARGMLRWVIARGQVEVDEADKAVNFPGVIVDITETKQNELKNAFLARVSRELGSTLDYKKTLAAIAKLAVPDIADWCSVEILDEHGIMQQVAVAHKDPEKVRWAKAYRAQRTDRDDKVALNVMQSGKPAFYPDITDATLVATAQSEEDLRLARELALSSAIIVPLSIQGKPAGILSMILTGGRRHYTQADLRSAQEVAARASLAMTNAHLFETVSAELQKNSELQQALQKSNDELERRVAERTAQLEQANHSLERSNQELQDFAYVASHDLQEPLRKIQAFGNLLYDEYKGQLGEGADYLERMRKAAARMSTLIQDLLSFSRVTTHAKEFSEVDLNIVLGEVLEDLDTRIADVQGVVEVPKKLPHISADTTQMRQLFQNLLANSLKFHQKDVPPQISITFKKQPHSVELLFSDNGIGFDEKYLDRIFAVFQRLHGRETYEGTGIGLAVCRKIVERHGGTITARSTPGHGATFVVTLATKQRREGPWKTSAVK